MYNSEHSYSDIIMMYKLVKQGSGLNQLGIKIKLKRLMC